jgi:membrane protein
VSLARRIPRTAAKAAMRWIDRSCASMAAAVACYAAFSLAPTLVIVVAVGGAFFGPEAVRGQLVGELRGLLGEDGARAVQGMIESAWLADWSGLKTVLSVLTLLIGATAVFAELSEDLNRLWGTPPRPGASAIGAFVRVRSCRRRACAGPRSRWAPPSPRCSSTSVAACSGCTSPAPARPMRSARPAPSR